LIIIDEPTNYLEEISNIDFENWLKAMKSKMDSIYTNHVLTLVDSLEGIKTIGM
jgi:ABC-type multidrug transport system ATPase subunit